MLRIIILFRWIPHFGANKSAFRKTIMVLLALILHERAFIQFITGTDSKLRFRNDHLN